MLLIGSKAAKYHFPDFRDTSQSDMDLICHESEFTELKSFFPNLKYKRTNKNKIKTIINGQKTDIDLSTGSQSNFKLLNGNKNILAGLSMIVAKPEELLMLKASHICFPLKSWNKTFKDYLFLKNKGVNFYGIFALEEILKIRIEETKKRFDFKDHNFDLPNNKFFNDSVKRIVPHDDIHNVLSFGREPLFLKIKKDKSNAKVSYELFNDLSYNDQSKLILEEILVLVAERVAIPTIINDGLYNYNKAVNHFYKKMCIHYLPFDFRMFAIDNYENIMKLCLYQKEFEARIRKLLYRPKIFRNT